MAKHINVKTAHGVKHFIIAREKLTGKVVSPKRRKYVVMDSSKNVLAILYATTEAGSLEVGAKLAVGTLKDYEHSFTKLIRGKDHNAVFAKVIKRVAKRAV